MSTIILLSSSPPPVFARSPTPADSSSPLPSTAALIHGNSPGRRKFKNRDATRDGFPAAFSTARQVLAEKRGAKNTLIVSPSRNRFRSSQDGTIDDTKDIVDKHKATKPIQRLATGASNAALLSQRVSNVEPVSYPVTTRLYALAEDTEEIRQDSDAPLFLERAVPRKLDWTPSKQKPGVLDGRPIEYSAGFMNGMLQNFTHLDQNRPAIPPQHVQAVNPAKRRRLDSTRSSSTEVKGTTSAPKLIKSISAPVKPASKRNKSPAKKPLTITGLATSNYLGHDEVNETPLMQYLTSTQAQLNIDGLDSVLETKVKKTRATANKLKGTSKLQTKSLLLSPKSAMKTYHEQDAIFGSASQLARDESPTFLRETIEAMKQSESFLSSDPILSSQRTQNLSVENTPQAGVARFKKTRNLWAAAGRDEDNALLHVDTVDLTDTPAVRAAFAGKDVMVQASTRRAMSPNATRTSLRGGYSPLVGGNISTVVDIGDIESPNVNQARMFSTTVNNSSPRRSPRGAPKEEKNAAQLANKVSIAHKDPPPPKPNYAGFSIHDMNKQIKSYGFKAMRKREKMIELLDRCWEEKYGPTENVPAPESEVVPFGDFLSKVHDISARPEPKVKKPRAKKKKDEPSEKPGESAEKSAKKPRQRKKKDNETEPTKPKVPRKRKSTKVAAANGSNLNTDAITETIPEELRVLEAFDDWARPERKPKSKTQSQPVTSTSTEITRLPTPPATLPQEPASAPCRHEDIFTLDDANTRPSDPVLVPTPTPSPVSISSQITAAIMHQSKVSTSDRNHNTNPTWHEKILLYDPIILEDLASWLNTEGLGAISEDREISALDVREWCESKGICCLWRGGWRGNKLAQ